MLHSLKNDWDKYNWEMTEGGTVEEFLGIQVDPTTDGGFKLIQTGLIEEVMRTLGLQNCNPAVAPTTSPVPLGPDPQGKATPYQHKWSYPLVVGMLMYLASNSHPEISFAVHQCARFIHGPSTSMKKPSFASANTSRDVRMKA